MKLLRVRPSQIKVPEVRVTAQFDEETRALLKKMVQEQGLSSPIICKKVEEDLVLVDGLHRLQDAMEAADQPIDVAVDEGDMVDVLCTNLFLDKIRGKPPVGDMVRVIQALYQEYGLDVDKIGERTGLTRDYLEKLLKIATAGEEVRAALDAEAIGVGVAYELSRLPHPLQQEEVLRKTTVYRLRVKDVKELVDGALAAMEEAAVETPPATPGEPPKPIEYKCQGCGNVIEPRYVQTVLVCPDCFGHIWRLGKARKEAEAVAAKETVGD